jgi:hypothetical protein
VNSGGWSVLDTCATMVSGCDTVVSAMFDNLTSAFEPGYLRTYKRFELVISNRKGIRECRGLYVDRITKRVLAICDLYVICITNVVHSTTHFADEAKTDLKNCF